MKKRKKAKPVIKESDLAARLIADWERLGYECYKEVCHGGGSIRNDCFFVKRDAQGVIVETVAVETKTSFTLKVIEQAWHWREYAHKTFVGIPAGSGAHPRQFSVQLCEAMGIGVVSICLERGSKLVKDGKLNPRPAVPKLYEQQKDSLAGNAESSYYTPFKNTCRLLSELMALPVNQGIPLLDAIAAIDHHYAHARSGYAAMKALIEKGDVPGYRLEKKGRTTLIYSQR